MKSLKSIWPKRSPRKKALTLLELLVSIALLGFLLFGVATFLEVMGKSSKALQKSSLQKERELLYQTLYPRFEKLKNHLDKISCEDDRCHFEFEFISKADRDPNFIGDLNAIFDFKDETITFLVASKKQSNPPIAPRQILELHSIKRCFFEQLKFKKDGHKKSPSVLRLFVENLDGKSTELCFLLRQKEET